MEIKETILKIARNKKIFKFKDVFNALKNIKVSRQYVSSILNAMVKDGDLVSEGYGRYTFYALPRNVNNLGKQFKKRLLNVNLEEDVVYNSIEKSRFFAKKIKENVHSVFRYAFMEMLNNAIEHSQSKYVNIEIKLTENNLTFIVDDFGIGAFRNVMQKHQLKSELEAIQDILKGRVTTQPRAHSGEGIFFTSKAADLFILESYGYRLRVDNLIEDVFIEEIDPIKRGTKVIFTVSLDSKKHLNNLFEQYQTDPSSFAFDKTEVMIKLYAMGTIYISRSQARRVLSKLDRFKTVILDFDQVPTVGQAFADEIFRVYQLKHPEITIKPINMNKAAEFIIKRVEKP